MKSIKRSRKPGQIEAEPCIDPDCGTVWGACEGKQPVAYRRNGLCNVCNDRQLKGKKVASEIRAAALAKMEPSLATAIRAFSDEIDDCNTTEEIDPRDVETRIAEARARMIERDMAMEYPDGRPGSGSYCKTVNRVCLPRSRQCEAI